MLLANGTYRIHNSPTHYITVFVHGALRWPSDRKTSPLNAQLYLDPPTRFFITPKNGEKNVYVISPLPVVAFNPEGAVRLALIVDPESPESKIAIGGFPYDPSSPDVSTLPGCEFTSVNI
ncbi:hypothetical protein CPC08DRAFT_731703 [Agrocybe pediades]|nr:hypothetical protein CPC08DRAFT_731703 [Agrocybe pediades]